MSEAEDRLRQEVRDAMSTYETEASSDVTWRVVRKGIIGIFLSFAAFALLQQLGGDIDKPSAKSGRASGAANATVQADGGDTITDRDVSNAVRELVIRSGRGGHFTLAVTVNGTELPFIVDTGASSVFLSADAARQAGIDPDGLDYSRRYRTANGTIAAAPVVLREVRIGQLSIRDVEATVSRSRLPMSLLGMTFLERLESYEVRDGKLVLRW